LLHLLNAIKAAPFAVQRLAKASCLTVIQNNWVQSQESVFANPQRSVENVSLDSPDGV
jgi:hypothetical protein